MREKIKVEYNLDVTFSWHECRLEEIILQNQEYANILTTTTKSSLGLGSLHFINTSVVNFLIAKKNGEVRSYHEVGLVFDAIPGKAK